MNMNDFFNYTSSNRHSGDSANRSPPRKRPTNAMDRKRDRPPPTQKPDQRNTDAPRLSGAQRRKIMKGKMMGPNFSESSRSSRRGPSTSSAMWQPPPIIDSNNLGDMTGILGALFNEMPNNNSSSVYPSVPTNFSNMDSNIPNFSNNDFNRKPKSFSEIVMGTRWLSVVADGHPSQTLTLEQTDELQESINQEIDKIPKGGFTPRFDTAEHVQGTLRVVCIDKDTEDWMRYIVNRISPWQGLYLQVLEGEFLSRLQNVTATYVGVDIESDLIFRRLARENRNLNTTLWRLYNKKRDGDTTLLALGIDTASMRELEALNFKVNAGLNSVVFEVDDSSTKYAGDSVEAQAFSSPAFDSNRSRRFDHPYQ